DVARAHLDQAIALRDQVAAVIDGEVRAAFLERPDVAALGRLNANLAAAAADAEAEGDVEPSGSGSPSGSHAVAAPATVRSGGSSTASRGSTPPAGPPREMVG